MKIGVYLAGIPSHLGGGARFQNQAVTALAAAQSDEHEFCTIGHYRDSGFSLPHVYVPEPPSATRLRRLAERAGLVSCYQKTVLELLKQKQVDLVYSPHHQTLTTEIPYVVTCWDLQHRLQPLFPEVSTTGWKWESREEHYKPTFQKAAAVVSGTQCGADEIELFYGVAPERICKNPFFTPDALLGHESVKPDGLTGERFVLYPAQFWPHKNHITILLALAQLQEAKGLKLTAVFPGAAQPQNACTLDHVTRTAERLGVSVLFPGFVSDGELRWLYQNCEALVFASLFGPDNLPPLEAMSLDCPVIASDVAGASEQYGDAAILVKPADEFAMANAIGSIVDDSQRRAHLVERGRALAATLTPGGYAANLLRLFDELSRYLRCWSS